MTAIVGILNVTPDSFAETGRTLEPAAAVERARGIMHQGADVLDVGAESTRPGAAPLDADAEWARLAPCLPRIIDAAAEAGVPVSIDTRHATTAARALDLGAAWINAVDGVSDSMAAVLAAQQCRVVVMHAVTVPVVTGKTLAPDLDAVAHLKRYFAQRLVALERAGVDRERVIIDPGIGFGTTPRHALQIVDRWRELADLARPVMVGHSRKSFLRHFTDAPAPERDDVTMALSGVLMAGGIDYLRVHAVARHVEMRRSLAGSPQG